MSSSAVCEEKMNNVNNFYFYNSLMCPGPKDKFIIRKPGKDFFSKAVHANNSNRSSYNV